MSGIGEEMGDVGMAIQRAEDKTAQMQARAGAIDELIASGALEDASQLNQGDDIARELEAMSSQSDVEAELARLKSGSQPEAIEAGDGDILADEPETQTQTQASGESKDSQ
jgi:phage shock protein A